MLEDDEGLILPRLKPYDQSSVLPLVVEKINLKFIYILHKFYEYNITLSLLEHAYRDPCQQR